MLSARRIDPRLPSLQLVVLLGCLAFALILLSSQNLALHPLPGLSSSSTVVALAPDSTAPGAEVPDSAATTEGAADGSPPAQLHRALVPPACPRSTRTVRLLFPHVNKAGGRTIEGTFNQLVNSNSFLSQAPRSRRLEFELVDGHKDYPTIVRATQCTLPSRKCNLASRPVDECTRWIFMMRDPVARTLSAFYTSVGRPMPATHMANPMATHFACLKGSRAAKILADPASTFEDFAALPLALRRTSCYPNVANLHVKYLDPKTLNLEEAKRRLSLMDWVGFSEHFALSMQLLSFDLDLDLDLYTPVFNQNVYNASALSERAMEALLDMNRLDIELYEYAKTRLFQPRVDAMRSAHAGAWPWRDQLPARCDKEVVCFDKRSKSASAAWALNDPPANVLRMDPGEHKENVLCAPKMGCALAKPGRPASKCVASFFIIGARKGGTTSLYQYITSHPHAKGILLDKGAKTGETFFFERESVPPEDPERKPALQMRQAYNKIFSAQFVRADLAFDPRVDITGESSVGMGPSCYTPRALKDTCGPDLRMIYLVRDPVERMQSQFAMRQRLQNVPETAQFASSARADLAQLRLKAGGRLDLWLADPLHLPVPCVFTNDEKNSVWSGLYVVHVARWLQHFAKPQLLLLQSETFFKQPAPAAARVMEFLGLNTDLVNTTDITATAYNAAPPGAKKEDEGLDAELRHELAAYFAPFNKLLKEWFPNDVDLDLWAGLNE